MGNHHGTLNVLGNSGLLPLRHRRSGIGEARQPGASRKVFREEARVVPPSINDNRADVRAGPAKRLVPGLCAQLPLSVRDFSPQEVEVDRDRRWK